jgi:hypothetical protein
MVTYVYFKCSHGCAYQERKDHTFSSSSCTLEGIPMETLNVQKTNVSERGTKPSQHQRSTTKSMDKDNLCQFGFTIFHMSHDNFWYLCQQILMSDNLGEHKFHPKMFPRNIAPSVKSLDSSSLALAQKCHDVNF